MIDEVIATCRGCGHDVTALEIVAVAPVPDGTGIAIGWKHNLCGASSARVISRESAIAIKKRMAEEHVISPEEKEMDLWRLELDVEPLTVYEFMLRWKAEGWKYEPQI